MAIKEGSHAVPTPLSPWRRSRLIVLAVPAVLLLAVVIVLSAQSVGHATSGGSPYTVPSVHDTNPNPHIVETTFTAQEANVDIGNGVTAHAETFNGQIPGPTFQLHVGDTVIVHYKNDLPFPSGIHWHGIELSNEMDGTPFTQNQVPPGGTFLYKFKVTRPGLFWYHPHHHSSTNQVFRGLYGMIVVKDPNGPALQASHALPSTANTKLLVLSDTTVCKDQGSNDTATYDPSAPWAGGGPLPVQPGPTPKDLCETPTAIDENGDLRAQSYNKNDIPAIQTKGTSGRENEGQTVLTNGKNVGGRAGDPSSPGALSPNASVLNVRPGQGLRLQILNASAIRYMRLRLTDSNGNQIPLIRVGGEGGLLDYPIIEGNVLPPPPSEFVTDYDSGEILLPGGSRADVVAAIPSNASGVATMWTEDYKRVGPVGGFWAKIPTVPVMHLNVTGTPVSPAYSITPQSAFAPPDASTTKLRAATGHLVENLGGLPTGQLLDPAAFSPPKLGLGPNAPPPDNHIRFTQSGGAAGVNGTFGTHDVPDYQTAAHLGSSRYAKEGDVLELNTDNATQAHHPFHEHGFSIQPISLTKSGSNTYTWPYREFRDNVDIPPGYTLKFRLRLDPRPMSDNTTPGGALGRWLFHCHIFFHATNGMLSELVVLPATGKERPDVNVDSAEATVKQGGTATMTGTFYEPNPGDSVTSLTASVGTVAKTGGATWKWTYPTGSTNSRVVYITATDNNGLRSQIPFQLTVVNTQPVLHVPGSQTVFRGSPLTIRVKATDVDAIDKIKLAAKGLPKKLKFKDKGNRKGKASGLVIARAKLYNAIFSAFDGHHSIPVKGIVKIRVRGEKLSALVDHPEKLHGDSIKVGCRFRGKAIRTCAATLLSGGQVVGQGSATRTTRGRPKMSVTVPIFQPFLGGTSLFPLAVDVRLTAQKFGWSKTFSAHKGTTIQR